jgi:hypothetical protein
MNFSGAPRSAAEFLSVLGAIGFGAGLLAMLVGTIWFLVGLFRASGRQPPAAPPAPPSPTS